MELFERGTDPWGQEVLVRASWDVLYLFFWAGIAFILFHLVYAAVWAPKLAKAHADVMCCPGPKICMLTPKDKMNNMLDTLGMIRCMGDIFVRVSVFPAQKQHSTSSSEGINLGQPSQ